MDETPRPENWTMLGIAPDASREAVKKAFVQQSYAAIGRDAREEERERLRAAHDAIVLHLDALERQPPASAADDPAELARLEAEAERNFGEPELSRWDPRSFDSRIINALAPPAVAFLAVLLQKSVLGFFFTGFHVWIHEFGHATVGWMSGRRALPLPIGWTPISPEQSNFVYCGLLFLFGLMLVAGFRERKIWPMVLAVLLALLQAEMTWRLRPDATNMAIDFAGVGGEFYLSAAMIGLFYFQFPEKFRWGACRYFFLFVGAASFFETYTFWKRVKRGEEGIPYGSMINGEEDAGGDMNGLHDEFGWTQHQIISTYNHLGDACLIALVVVYAVFALRLDRIVKRLLPGWA